MEKTIEKDATAIATSNTSSIARTDLKVKSLTEEMIAKLKAPLPPEAVSQHPTKQYLSSIKAIYVVERLNDVFGIGKWSQRNEVISDEGKMKTVHSFIEIPEYGIHLDNFGGNDNVDEGDAFKGAVTDALTKMASYLGIGMDVYKGKSTPRTTQNYSSKPPIKTYPKPQPKSDSPYEGLLRSIQEASNKPQLDDIGKQVTTLAKNMTSIEVDLLREAYSLKLEDFKLPTIEHEPVLDINTDDIV